MKNTFLTAAVLAVFIGGGTFASANSTKGLEVVDTSFNESIKVGEVEPEAIPAVVGGAFLAGVAYKAGTKATSWVLDKLGSENVEPTIEYQEELDVVFD